MRICYLSLMTIVLIFACVHNKHKHDLHYERLEPSNDENKSYSIYRMNEDFLDKKQLAKLESLRELSSDLLIVPDSVHNEFFYPGIPYSPTTGFRFFLTNADSIKIYIKPVNEPDDFYISIISEKLPLGYYLILYNPKNLYEGIYNMKYCIGEDVKTSKFVLLR